MSPGKYVNLSHCHENLKFRNCIIGVGVINYCINICNWADCCEGNVHVFFMKKLACKVSTTFSFHFPISQVKGLLIYLILYSPPFLLHGSIVLCHLVCPRHSSVVGHEVSRHHKPDYLPCMPPSRTTRVWLCTADWRAM